MTIPLLLFAVFFLAYSNGANDNFKGVASLYGSGTLSYRSALIWATAGTLAGSMAAMGFAQALLRTFSGKGLVPDHIVGSWAFVAAVALGAASTVILATVTGFPVSTTHALMGAMVGSGWVAVGSAVELRVLGTKILLPLLLSPLLAVLLGAGLYLLFRWSRVRMKITKEWCFCVGEEERTVAIPLPSSVLALRAESAAWTARIDQQQQCVERYTGAFWGIGYQKIMDSVHIFSGGVVSFARGLNDTPKIAALLLVFPALHARSSLLLVAAAIAVGGVLSARRVAETMSRKITGMNRGQGLSANFATGLLVIAASLFGLPVSTTHVSVGSLFGIGMTSNRANYRVIRDVLLSWVLTLPCAALIGALVYGLVSR